MATKDLTPLNLRTPEERREIAIKGGSVKSPAKSLAAKIRALDWANPENRTEQVKKIIDILTDSQLSAFAILKSIEGIEEENLTVEQKIKVTNLRINAHKMIYGEKTSMMSVNTNMDITQAIISAYENRVNEQS